MLEMKELGINGSGLGPYTHASNPITQCMRPTFQNPNHVDFCTNAQPFAAYGRAIRSANMPSGRVQVQ